jgi:hypothetical protein
MNQDLKNGDALYIVESAYGELDPEKLIKPFRIDKVKTKGDFVFAHIQDWDERFIDSPHICGHKKGRYMVGRGWCAILYPRERAIQKATESIRANLYENLLYGVEALEKAGFNVQLSPKQQ